MMLEKDWHSSVEENIRCGLIEMLILSMLSNGDMYAYELKRTLEQKSNGVFKMRDGSLYGPMYRMLDRNLISSRQELVGQKRFRNYYHIEESGKEYLEYSVKKFYEIFGFTDSILSECANGNKNSEQN
ncbi:MAG: PadR family transcriptional regulator [Clostridia bacterium]|nr:PadR family transcriptional regulator [Clostridia bacterium]